MSQGLLSTIVDTAFYRFEQTARIHTIRFRKWKNKISKLKYKKSIIFVTSPAATVHLVQKVLLSSKIKQKITPVALQNFVASAKIRPERISESNGIIGRRLGFVIGRLNT